MMLVVVVRTWDIRTKWFILQGNYLFYFTRELPSLAPL